MLCLYLERWHGLRLDRSIIYGYLVKHRVEKLVENVPFAANFKPT